MLLTPRAGIPSPRYTCCYPRTRCPWVSTPGAGVPYLRSRCSLLQEPVFLTPGAGVPHPRSRCSSPLRCARWCCPPPPSPPTGTHSASSDQHLHPVPANSPTSGDELASKHPAFGPFRRRRVSVAPTEVFRGAE